MAKDKQQVLQSVLGAILQSPSSESEKRSSGLSTGRAVLLGAGLFAAGRLTAGRGGGLIGSLQNRLEGTLNDDAEQEEPEGYEDEDFEDAEGDPDEEFEEEEDEEDVEDPEGYEDDEDQAEYDDKSEGGDEELDDEPVDEEDFDDDEEEFEDDDEDVEADEDEPPRRRRARSHA